MIAAPTRRLGSGAFGASAAYHLARRGRARSSCWSARRCLPDLAARGRAVEPGPRHAGAHQAGPAGRRKLAAFTARPASRCASPRAAPSRSRGPSATPSNSAAKCPRRHDRRAIDFVSVAEARRRLPILGERGIVAMTWSPTDCNVEPSERRSATVAPRRSWRRAAAAHAGHGLRHRRAAASRACATPDGTIATRDGGGRRRRLGAGRRRRARRAGCRSCRRAISCFITEPIPGVAPELPIARVIDANVYVRHERGGLMLGGYESDPLQVDLPRCRRRSRSPSCRSTSRCCGGWRRSVAEQFPIFQDPAIQIAEHRGGLPTMTIDDRYLVGPLPGRARGPG